MVRKYDECADSIEPDLQTAVRSGISKINIATHLNQVFRVEVPRMLNSDAEVMDPRKYV